VRRRDVGAAWEYLGGGGWCWCGQDGSVGMWVHGGGLLALEEQSSAASSVFLCV
jgi:hypothetical protein